MKSKAEAQQKEFLSQRKERDGLQNRLEKQQAALSSLELNISLEQLLSLQKEVRAIELELSNLKKLMVSEDAKVAKKTNSNMTLEKLTKEREDLLAEIASGVTDKSRRLEELEKLIHLEEEEHDKEVSEAITASHTLAGLKRKVDQAERKLLVAKEHYTEGLKSFMQIRLEEQGAMFVKLAIELNDIFNQIRWGASIITQLDGAVQAIGPRVSGYQIPSFALEACKEVENPNTPGVLFTYKSVIPDHVTTVEKQKLAELGITIGV